MDGLPKLFLISRKALADSPGKVAEALRLTPITGVFAACELDAKIGAALSEQVMGFQTPFALVADFPFDIAYIDSDGHLVPAELKEVEAI